MNIFDEPEPIVDEPESDIADCDTCDWSGLIADCPTEQDGDWETGYYTINVCPVCESSVELNMSTDRYSEWGKWYKKHREVKETK